METRWRQRYANFQKAMKQLDSAVKLDEYNNLERQGLIHCFEYTIELAWKTLQDLLEAKGYNVKEPKPVINQAFQDGYIVDGDGWIVMLDSRNLITYTYDEDMVIEVSEKIKGNFHKLLDDLNKQLAQECLLD
jgi:nucleotidyltransferase substrate binding protein (TIGR01987 family)